MIQRLFDEGLDPSVGFVGDDYDNALAETTVGSFTTGTFRRLGLRRDVDYIEVDYIEVDTAQCTPWFQPRATSTSTTSTPSNPSTFTTICQPWQPPGDSTNRDPGTRWGSGHHHQPGPGPG